MTRLHEIHEFARKEVRPTLIRRYENHEFSRELWSRMAEAGLFRFLIPPEYGGSGKGHEALVEAIEAFILGGNDLGLCLSWLDHLLIHTNVIARFGTEDQKRTYLPDLICGKRIGALAASEPGSGANPVKMRTNAERLNGTFRIQGEKIFITNGPVADFVIVLARTGPPSDKEGISAFLVDTSTPGFRIKKEMDFGFLNTSPHGELVFDGCRVPVENLVGRPGDGHVRISRAVFACERFLLLVALATHFRLVLKHILRELSKDTESLSEETRGELAVAHVTLEGVGELAKTFACEVLDRNGLDPRLMERLLFLGHTLKGCWDLLKKVLKETGLKEEPPLSILLKDAKLLHVNERLIRLQLDRVAGEAFKRARPEEE